MNTIVSQDNEIKGYADNFFRKYKVGRMTKNRYRKTSFRDKRGQEPE